MTSSVSHDNPADELLRELHRVTSANRDAWRRLMPGQNVATLAALSALQRLGPSRVRDLAYELRVDVSVASRQASALQAAGLVGRTQDPDDGRAQLLELSDAGRAELEHAHESALGAYEELLADWDEDEVRTLVAGLARLREALADGASAHHTPHAAPLGGS